MKEETSLSNQKVAEIYQSMLKGQKNALTKLNQLNLKNQIPKFIDNHYYRKAKINKQYDQDIDLISNKKPSSQQTQQHQQEEFRQTSSFINTSQKKQQLYFHALKKGAKFASLLKPENAEKVYRQRKWINSSNSQYQNLQNDKNLRKSETKTDQSQQILQPPIKSVQIAETPAIKRSKISVLPRVSKLKQLLKVQSSNLQPPKKNISLSQPEKSIKPEKKAQRIDFKQMIGKNKKQRQQLQKKNEEQRACQIDIMEYHSLTKQILESTKQKYHLNFNNNKYLKRKKKQIDNNPLGIVQQTQSEKMSPFKTKIQIENLKCNNNFQQINTLKIAYNSNLAILNKLQVQLNINPFQKYWMQFSDRISEDQREQDDTVQPLEEPRNVKNKYSHLMAHTRQKKWGLMQRTQYQSQRTQSLDQSRKTGISSRKTDGGQEKMHFLNTQQSKITFNQKLKKLLFN